MSALALAASIDGPSPTLVRIAAHLARAESRDRVFTTIPVETLRSLLILAGATARELDTAMRDAEADAQRIPAEHRAAYLSARWEQLVTARAR